MKTCLLQSLGSLVLALLLTAPVLAQSPADSSLQAGKDYEVIDPPQPTADPSKIEVIEFFWYGCPHCYHFEPDLNAWLKKKPANVEFIREPAVFDPESPWAAHAKAFYTAQALGIIDAVHKDFYEAIQNQQRKLLSEQELAEFFKEHGVSEEEFRKAYKSFAVDTKMRQAPLLAPRYGIHGTPAVVINGKYRTGSKMVKSFPRLIEVMNALIERESESLPAPRTQAK
jgi:thiol:disulfide interchange protein DsbA